MKLQHNSSGPVNSMKTGMLEALTLNESHGRKQVSIIKHNPAHACPCSCLAQACLITQLCICAG